MPHLPRRAIAILVAILIIIAVAVLLERLASGFMSDKDRTPPPLPPLTPERTVAAIGAQSPVALVSYVSTGFEPTTLSVKKGDIVRFINNSRAPLTITQDMPLLTGCVPAVLSTCEPLVPGDYIDFTFTGTGDWQFHAGEGRGVQGSVHVQ